jgi:hypothetical protein
MKQRYVFRYNFLVGAQIIPQKYLCDRIEKDGWDGCQGQKIVRGSVYLYQRGDSPTHNNQMIRPVLSQKNHKTEA